MARRIGDLMIAYILVAFVCFDYERTARKRFLHHALLAKQSIFREFTDAGNRMRGNISLEEVKVKLN